MPCFLAAVALVFLPASCRPERGPADSRSGEPAVAFIGAGRDHALWPVLRAGAERYVAEFGIEGVLIDAPRFTSPREQIEMLEELPGRGFRGVCVQVDNPELMAPVIRRLVNAGLRVTTMVHDAAEDLRSGFCGINDVEVGRSLAEATVEVLGGRGSIVVLHAGEGRPIYGNRLWAFRDAMRSNSGIEIYFWRDCQDSPADAERQIRKDIDKYPNLSAFVALDDWPLRFLEAKPPLLPPTCKLIAFGAVPANWKYLRDGTCGALVEADHSTTGYDALMLCYKAVRDEELIVNRIELPLVIVKPGKSLDRFAVEWVTWSTPPE